MTQTENATLKPILRAVFGSKVFIAQYLRSDHVAAMTKMFRCFSTENTIEYFPLCDDFGPMSFLSVVRFIEILDEEIASSESLKVAYCVESGRRALTNAIFMLGCYLILKHNASADDVDTRFSWVDRSCVEPFRDATFAKPDFDLSLLDCWRGLERARTLGWLRLPSPSAPEMWGQIDIGEYTNYDDPLNGDLHIVVPGLFVAFKGPRDLPALAASNASAAAAAAAHSDSSAAAQIAAAKKSAAAAHAAARAAADLEYLDDPRGCRFFSPEYYVDIFRALGVTDVVRLNECEYDASAFAAAGIAHHHLEFADCTAPPPAVVAAFVAAADAAAARGGLVAVHCRAGLGRTGTLIALCMMRSYGFAAREAIAWLRFLRPGCVIGAQQHFLASVDQLPAAAAAQVAAGMDRKAAARAAQQLFPVPARGFEPGCEG